MASAAFKSVPQPATTSFAFCLALLSDSYSMATVHPSHTDVHDISNQVQLHRVEGVELQSMLSRQRGPPGGSTSPADPNGNCSGAHACAVEGVELSSSDLQSFFKRTVLKNCIA